MRRAILLLFCIIVVHKEAKPVMAASGGGYSDTTQSIRAGAGDFFSDGKFIAPSLAAPATLESVEYSYWAQIGNLDGLDAYLCHGNSCLDISQAHWGRTDAFRGLDAAIPFKIRFRKLTGIVYAYGQIIVSYRYK